MAWEFGQTPRVEEGRRAIQSCLRLSRVEISFLREQEDNIERDKRHEEHTERDGAHSRLDRGLGQPLLEVDGAQQQRHDAGHGHLRDDDHLVSYFIEPGPL